MNTQLLLQGLSPHKSVCTCGGALLGSGRVRIVCLVCAVLYGCPSSIRFPCLLCKSIAGAYADCPQSANKTRLRYQSSSFCTSSFAHWYT
jgi:hypothetical protein